MSIPRIPPVVRVVCSSLLFRTTGSFFFQGEIVTSVIDPPRNWEEMGIGMEIHGECIHATIPGPFANRIPEW